MDIPSIIRKTSPALVSIILTKHTARDSRSSDSDIPQTELETGTGFFADKNGLILTNRHVVYELDGEYWVWWNNKKYFAEILGRDHVNDVAVLRIQERDTPHIQLGDSSRILLGESVVALGNVFGELHNTVSAGIVSGLSRNIYAVDEPYRKTFELRGLIQTDAAINPGNSGGPLLNMQGKAIGINTATVSGYENIGFAIPINHARFDIQEIQKFGTIRKPYLGIRYITLDASLASRYGLAVDYGAYILREPEPDGLGVIPQSPADRAGLKEGDIIVSCENQRIAYDKTLKDIIREKQIGSKVKLKVVRQDKELETELLIEEQK